METERTARSLLVNPWVLALTSVAQEFRHYKKNTNNIHPLFIAPDKFNFSICLLILDLAVKRIVNLDLVFLNSGSYEVVLSGLGQKVW